YCWIKMYNGELLLERLQMRQRVEAERRERIFNDKVRTIGVYAEMLHNSRVLNLLHRKQQKEKRTMEKALVAYQHQCQLPWSQRERGLKCDDGQMMLPGLAGEDPYFRVRQQKQKAQLKQWLIEQQTDQSIQRQMDNKALELQSAEVQTRNAVAVATKEHNLAMVSASADSHYSWEGMGLERKDCQFKSTPERLQEMILFQKHQMKEKWRMEMEKKQENGHHDRVRLDSARTALLMERQQARQSKELRCNLDRTNVKIAQDQREQGRIDESFFTQFNTCSR
uniref:RIB43A domain with coiled-coils 2 n=1 Tax=Takifugu rubripes TaxID=31033 RepID=A0A674P8X7_TAKRU